MAPRINSEVKAVSVNGTKVPVVDGSFSWESGAPTREPLMGSGRVLGFPEANAAGTCSFDIAYQQGTAPSEFDNITGATIRVDWDGGSKTMMKNAASVAGASGSAGAGTYTLSYAGDPWLTTKK